MTAPAGRVVVVGVDGSEESLEALRWAARQAELIGATVRAVSCWHWPAMLGFTMPLPDVVDLQAAARAMLEQRVAGALGPDVAVRVEQHVVEGPAAMVLLRQAVGAEMLVLGSRGRGGFSGLLLGSVSAHCVQHAPCPVVVVRHGEHAAS